MGAGKLPVVGIVSGTGREGSALALRLAQSGFTVVVGSRSQERATEKAHELATLLRNVGLAPTLSGAANSEVVRDVDVLFLSVPFAHVLETARKLTFRPGSLVVDTSVPVVFNAGKAELVEVKGGSVSEELRALIPAEVHVVGAFKTIPARILGDIDSELGCDVFVCGDSQEAKSTIIQLAGNLSGLRPLDAGPLSSARTLERMSALAIQLNLRYKVKSARFRVVGL
ncbi:MAG: NADPH-dependent F420 reductase [Acidobacteria bacterium]|nr:MAG: NADPH-dependent F420 reductase [Acidobacteriota bacterium]